MARQLLRCILLTALAVPLASHAATRDDDDSCDIAALPSATLLLPYFEVDLDDPNGETTVFTITNVWNFDTIARVTLWTDRGYPVLTFNTYLTGYDVQSLDLRDIFAGGVSAPATGTRVTKRGNYADVNARLNLNDCQRLGGPLADDVVARLRHAFLEGTIPGECAEVGGAHDRAIGYATIDVVGNCSTSTPLDAEYWTRDLRYANVLIGDYQQINTTSGLAQAGPLVHIRAIPEGGAPGERRASSEKYGAGFPRTFYARFQSPLAPDLDGRQPLPSQFATRWIQGGAAEFETTLKIWREGRAGADASCSAYSFEDDLAVREIVVFDEQENAVGSGERIELAATSRKSVDDPNFPQLANGAVSGWIYLNLDRSGRDDIASQAWVISSMRAQSQYSTDIDAIALGNGCTAPAEKSEISFARGSVIAPAPDESHLQGVASTDNDASCDIALLPAATLLLPYFEIEFGPPPDLPDPPDPPTPPVDPTLFTITNVSPHDQIARVTLWTDYAYPVLTFNIFLTGYDVQSINLDDVIRHGVIAPENGTGTLVTRRGAWSDRNRELDRDACGRLPGRLPDEAVARMQSAFRQGIIEDMGTLQGCNRIGDVHQNAIGYATIDVVRNCETNSPWSDEYWSEDLAWDNVLIGDYQQVDPYNSSASGGTLVHIRAVPEGGTSAERLAIPRKFDAGFDRTFYSRYQSAQTPRHDGRQPLPSVFAARWQQGIGFATSLKIWREGSPGRRVTCRSTTRAGGAHYAEVVTFDENENGIGDVPVSRITPIFFPSDLPSTSSTSVADTRVFNQLWNGAARGWIYLNLDNSATDAPLSISNWVISSMSVDGQHAFDFDATAFANGCNWQEYISEVTTGTEVIGPDVKP